MSTYQEILEANKGRIIPLDLPEPDKDAEIVALGAPIFETVKRIAWWSQTSVHGKLCRKLPEGNLWLLQPDNDRLAWPLSNFWIVCSMLVQEQIHGRRADWLLYLEDDVIVPPDIFDRLRKHADSELRPFVAGVGYCRNEPFWPGVTAIERDGPTMIREVQWSKAPDDEVHKVHTAPLCAALFHRSIFDRVPQPWFNTAPPLTFSNGITGPARWFCLQCHKVGINPHVVCDIDIQHIMQPQTVGRKESEAWNATTSDS